MLINQIKPNLISLRQSTAFLENLFHFGSPTERERTFKLSLKVVVILAGVGLLQASVLVSNNYILKANIIYTNILFNI